MNLMILKNRPQTEHSHFHIYEFLSAFNRANIYMVSRVMLLQKHIPKCTNFHFRHLFINQTCGVIHVFVFFSQVCGREPR